jgi:hypothetical protein
MCAGGDLLGVPGSGIRGSGITRELNAVDMAAQATF